MAKLDLHQLTDQEYEEFLANDPPTDPTMLLVWKAGHVSKERAAKEKSQQLDLPVEPQKEIQSNCADVKIHLPVQRALPLEARLRSAAAAIGTFGANDVFRSYPITASTEFPTMLTRLPIFRPSNRVTQQKIQDTDNAMPFETPYGVGRRHGPPLTIKDEDTLIVLMRFRDKAFSGPQSHLPENVRDFHQPASGISSVHRVTCTIKQLNERLEKSDSGENYKYTLASLKRLNACKIEFNRSTKDGGTEGGAFDLVKIQWRVYDEHGLIDAVFPPLMSNWLKHSYTFIDWEIRKKLTPLGKAVHRYYSGQRPDFTIGLKKLAFTVGYDGRSNRMKISFENAFQELIDIRWLKSCDITGNGRKDPFMVHTVREDTKKEAE